MMRYVWIVIFILIGAVFSGWIKKYLTFLPSY